MNSRILRWVVLLAILHAPWRISLASEGAAEKTDTPIKILPPEKWEEIDGAVDRGLKFLLDHQQADGSFEAVAPAQPAVTSLAVMAILSSGHDPVDGPYAKAVTRAIDYALEVQQPSGVFAHSTSGNVNNQTCAYNHAITGLMLGEAYGMVGARENLKMRAAITKAVEYSRRQQTTRKRKRHDLGGWRYPKAWGPNDSDLSITSWQLMFLRSVKNAGFDVPAKYVDDAMGFVRNCFDEEEKAFVYAQQQGPDRERYSSGGVVGGGIIAMAMAGEHKNKMVLQSADWILAHPFDDYNRRKNHVEDRYHYSAFYCSQAMYQVGGKHWQRFYPAFAKTLLKNQNTDGSWDAESRRHDHDVGNIYTTALIVLALTPPHQMLPIYQR